MSDVTIRLGWWVLPLLITGAAFLWALVPRAHDRRSGDYDFTFWLPAAFRFCGAVILSLLVWLIWAVLT